MSVEHQSQDNDNIIDQYPTATCPQYQCLTFILETRTDEAGNLWWHCYLCLAWHLVLGL